MWQMDEGEDYRRGVAKAVVDSDYAVSLSKGIKSVYLKVLGRICRNIRVQFRCSEDKNHGCHYKVQELLTNI